MQLNLMVLTGYIFCLFLFRKSLFAAVLFNVHEKKVDVANYLLHTKVMVTENLFTAVITHVINFLKRRNE